MLVGEGRGESPSLFCWAYIYISSEQRLLFFPLSDIINKKMRVV